MATAKKLQAKLAARVKSAPQLPQGTEREDAPPPTWFKLPKTLGACADALYKYREERLALERRAKEFEGAEKALRRYIIEELPQSQSTGVAGRVARVSIVPKPVYSAEDWSLVYAGIVRDYLRHERRKDGMQDAAFALLNRALTASTVKEVYEKGGTIEGVRVFNTKTVSISKL
jgi:hypothetical protein